MRIALTGATGGIGTALAKKARALGYPVRALVRSREKARGLEQLGVTLVDGDLGRRDALLELANGSDVFIHAAAQVGDRGTRPEFVRTNIDGTEACVEAAAKHGVKRFVHVSSVAVYGRPKHGTIDESYQPRAFGQPYEDTKYESERLVFRRGHELGLAVTAIRPPVVFGPDDRQFLPRVLKQLMAKRVVYINGGHAPFNLVNVEDVVDVIFRGAERSEAIGEAFNVAASPVPSFRQVIETIADATGLEPPKLSLPAPAAMLLARAMQLAYSNGSLKRRPPITPFTVTLLTLHVRYDASKARTHLGWDGGRNPLAALGPLAKQLVSTLR